MLADLWIRRGCFGVGANVDYVVVEIDAGAGEWSQFTQTNQREVAEEIVLLNAILENQFEAEDAHVVRHLIIEVADDRNGDCVIVVTTKSNNKAHQLVGVAKCYAYHPNDANDALILQIMTSSD